MHHLDHTAFVNACRDERGVGHHTLRAYSQDLRTFARFAQIHRLTDPLSKDDILAYHRHLRDELEAKPATIERRLVTLKSYFAWRADRNSALPSPFADVRISVRIPRRLPRPIDRDILKAVMHAKTGPSSAQPADQEVTVLMIKLLFVTGLRISELTNLKVRDVSADASQMIVRGKGNKGNRFDGGTLLLTNNGAVVDITGAGTQTSASGVFFGLDEQSGSPAEVGGIVYSTGDGGIVLGQFIAN